MGMFQMNEKNEKPKSSPAPVKHQSSRTNFMIDDKTSFSIKEAYKAGRTNLLFSLPDDQPAVVLISSTWPMEGKTTTCVNYAITFSQIGKKVLIIDADLRKPRIEKMFDIKEKDGLTNLLRGFVKLEDVIRETPYENLWAITSGHIPPNPAELLSSDEMKELLKSLKEKYDYIFIDTPPVNLLTDATILSSECSGVVMVVRQAATDHHSLKEALGKLEFANAKILGFVLNDADDEAMGYSRYRYKGKNYGRGYYKYNYYRYKYYNDYSYETKKEESKE